MINRYLLILKNRDHILFLVLALVSTLILLNNNDPRMSVVRGKSADLVAFLSSPVSWVRSLMYLEEENRLLREKLSEMELQVNQQLREISSRQDQQGQVETKMSTLQKANRELIWATNTCLKMLKHLPDSSKLNFRNSRDFAKMLEIYKEYVEPSKEATR